MTRERYLIVGLGSIGRRHCGNLRRLRPDAEIGVLRLTDGALSVAPEASLAPLGSIDDVARFAPAAAIVAGPATTHVAIASALVALGVPTLIEKPLSHDMEGLVALADAARRASVPVMIGYNMRFNPSLMAAKAELERVGEVMLVRAEVGQYLPDWRPAADYRDVVSARRELGGGALLELSHEIDYLYWFFGMPDRVTCRGGRYSSLEIDVEDAVELCLEYAGPKRLVSIHLDFVQRKAARNAKFIGSQGTLVWDATRDTIEIDLAGSELPLSIVKPMPDRNAMYIEELRQFIECVETGAPVPIDLRQGIDVMAIIDAAQRSMQTGSVERPVT